MTVELGALAVAISAGVAVAIMVIRADNKINRRWAAIVRFFEDEEKREDRLAVERFPTYESIMAVLRYKLPCGCYYDWATGPPSGMSCNEHMFAGMVHSGIPDSVIVAWRARKVLSSQGRFHSVGQFNGGGA